MLALTDDQLGIVMNAASGLPVEKRTVFLERVAARLALRGARISDADLDKAIRIALKGLVHQPAAFGQLTMNFSKSGALRLARFVATSARTKLL